MSTSVLIASMIVSAGSASSMTAPPNLTSGATVTLAGVVRDFRASNVKDGHPDFESTPAQGRGVYRDIVQDTLNAAGDPIFRSRGYKVSASARDGQGRPRMDQRTHIESRSGDVPAQAAGTEGGAVHSAESLADWFRDNPIVNASALFPLPLHDTGAVLSFDGDLRTQFASIQGFGGNKVFGYTFEVECAFEHSAGPTVLTFGADDCLWVFIDGKLVIDLGGDHDYAEQTIDLSRLSWLSPGQTYTMKIFYAERDKRSSRLRMETPKATTYVEPPSVSSLWD